MENRKDKLMLFVPKKERSDSLIQTIKIGLGDH
jgi:hypothetical protein